jgi:hypothetical protein
MKKIIALALAALSVVFASCRFDFDAGPRAAAAVFVPVESLYGATERGQPYIVLHLAATVMPENATNKRIEWAIAADSEINAPDVTLDGNRLTADVEGTVTVIATIRNGLAEGVDFTEHFDIVIELVSPFAVKNILGIPEALPIGEYTCKLEGEIVPSNTSFKNIDWSVIDADGTGAYFYGNVFTVNSKIIDPINNIRAAATGGTVTVRATVKDGLLDEGDYTQDFKIVITRGVIAVGWYRNFNVYPKACYWVNGQLFELPCANASNIYTFNASDVDPINSTAIGIVYAGGKQYIAGYYRRADNTNQGTYCYWVDGVEKSLPNSTYNYLNLIEIGRVSRALGIVAGGGFVYMLAPDNSYWKINVNDDTATKVTLTMPSGGSSSSFTTGGYNKIAVKNDGNVFIASEVYMGASTYVCYKWESITGDETTLNPVRIDALDGVSNLECVGVAGGEVYVAGGVLNSSGNLIPYYHRIGSGSYNVLNYSYTAGSGGDIETYSIIEQNGSPVFYSLHRMLQFLYSRILYWDLGGNITELPVTSYTAVPESVVYSDGDAYMVMRGSWAMNAGSLINFNLLAGYMVLREPFPFSKVITPYGSNDYNPNFSNRIYGIAVR